MGMNNHNDERLAKRGILNAECRINAEIGMKPNMRGQDEGRDLFKAQPLEAYWSKFADCRSWRVVRRVDSY
jgi:hypothetical protein